MAERPLEDQLADMHKANDRLMDVVIALSGLVTRMVYQNTDYEAQVKSLLEVNERQRIQAAMSYGIIKPIVAITQAHIDDVIDDPQYGDPDHEAWIDRFANKFPDSMDAKRKLKAFCRVMHKEAVSS
jgi:hypothetical protein